MKNGIIKLGITSGGAEVHVCAVVDPGDFHLPFEHVSQLYFKPLWEQAQREFFAKKEEVQTKS
jgi:hypothetical protein